VLAVVVLAALLVFAGAALTARVDGASMTNGLRDGDALLLDRVGVRFQAPQRGDVVVALQPNGVAAIKRVIGVPGDVLEIDGAWRELGGTVTRPAVLLRPGGRGPWQRLVEPYVTAGWVVPGSCCDAQGRQVTQGPSPVTVPADRFFLLGDSRDVSRDSRMFGLVPRDRIVGRAVARYWPVGRARLLDTGPTLVPI